MVLGVVGMVRDWLDSKLRVRAGRRAVMPTKRDRAVLLPRVILRPLAGLGQPRALRWRQADLAARGR